MPEGMNSPDTSRAVRVPESRSVAQTGARDPCLERPPSYFERKGAVAGSPEAVLHQWADAWTAKDLDAFFALYSDDFEPLNQTRANWRDARSRQIADSEPVRVTVESVALEPSPGNRMLARFVQRFEAHATHYSVAMEVELVRSNNSWLIVEERIQGLL